MAEEHKSISEREQEILAFWEQQKIFQKSLSQKAPKGNFVFFEGPPTANGKPGIHHAEARAFKDIIPRFRTMQGYRVERKGGWDTHGLPVELEVEKQLGFKSKKEIEEYGIAKFNAKCKESVWTYLKDWQEFTRRLGFWVDLENAYVTYKPEYVESLWWVIKQIWDKGLLYQDYRVTPHCPRCGTSLSSHELAQGYAEVKDLAVSAKFKIKGKNNEYFVAWTTTPWTLPANVALAVGTSIAYVKVKQGEDYLWLAKARSEVIGEGEVVEEVLGEKLVGMEYEPLYPFVHDAINGTEQEGKKAWYVASADFVTTTDGTGIVHTAVMYGADDFELGTKIGLPKYHLVKLDGTFVDKAGFLAGRLVTDEGVAIDIIKDLAHRGLLIKKEKYEHSYPHCWRCKSKIIYYAKDSWYIKMSTLREKMIKENKKIHWEPEHIQEGRFGEWLREVKDWAFSRERYWGTPLPIWVCKKCGEKKCVGSFQELKDASSDPSVVSSPSFDPHRPTVDEIVLKCEKCGGEAKRVPDVCDVWFDSGCMPYAQWHYPFENKAKIDPPSPRLRGTGKGEAYPADYISEAIDQTRGWFYTLLAVATLLGKERPYKNVICLGHVLDAKGKKMSKSLGNTIDPMEMIQKYGADAVRWYMYTVNQPGDSKRFDEKDLADIVRKVFNLLLNVENFYRTYAEARPSTPLRQGFVGQASSGNKKLFPERSRGGRNVLDRWILARLHKLIKDATDSLENYKITEPARDLGEFVNDLSTWWLRRSRDRFKEYPPSPPLKKGGNRGVEDKAAALAVLHDCLVTTAKLLAPFTPFLAEEVYLRLGGEQESVHLEEWPKAEKKFLDENLLKEMGQVRSVVSRALERRAEAGRNVRQALARMIVTLPEGKLDVAYLELLKDEVNVKEVEVKKGEYAVEIDVNLTPELVREGTIREIIRRVNAMRKNAKLTIQDRIELFIESGEEEIVKAIAEHQDALLSGTLAEDLRTSGEKPAVVESFRVNEFDLTVGITKSRGAGSLPASRQGGSAGK